MSLMLYRDDIVICFFAFCGLIVQNVIRVFLFPKTTHQFRSQIHDTGAFIDIVKDISILALQFSVFQDDNPKSLVFQN